MNNYLETVIFFYLLKHPDLVKQYKGKFFSTKYFQELFDVIKPYIIEYKIEPSLNQVIDLIKLANKDEFLTNDVVSTIWENRNDISGYSEDWLFKNTKAFAEWNNFYRGLQRVTAFTKQMQSEVTFENCESIINKAKTIWSSEMAFNIGTEVGHDFFDVDTHLIPDEDTQSTGYKFLDMCLGGGWYKGTLVCFMAPPKTGKTMWLANLAAKSVIGGSNTIFISMEMSYQKIAHRIGSVLFDIPAVEYKTLSKDKAYMQDKMRQFFQANIMKKPGKFILERFPTGSATMDDIENFILKKEEELSTPDKPFKFDNVFIDYANIMQSIKYGRTENLYLKVKSICEEIRAACIRNNWAGITATQINRSGFDSSDVTMSNVSESAGLLATVDALFGIIRTPLMRQAGVYYLKSVLSRDSDTMGYKKKFNMEKTYLKISEDVNENYIDDGIELPDEWKSESVYDNKNQNKKYNKPAYSSNNQQPQATTQPQTTDINNQPHPKILSLFGTNNDQPRQDTNDAGQPTPVVNTYNNNPYPKVDIGLTENQLAGIPLGVF